MVKSLPKAPVGVASWILFGAFCNCAGWILSVIHQLNPAGYLVTVLAGFAMALGFRQRLFPEGFRPLKLKQLKSRFRRPCAFAFLALGALAILGGALYPPSNADALTQRIPRVLNWLAEQRWHWIDGATASFNTRAAGFEWLMAPMLALLKTDRWVFVYNAVAFLLMPGLIYSLFTRLGVRKRVAWHWMWLTPTGYCFVLQAGSIGNDEAGAVFALAAVDFALRAKRGGRCTDAWLSVLAAALLTATKTSNLTLLLPWLIALWPSLSLLWSRPIASIGVAAIAFCASFFPTAGLNYHYARDWSGASFELPPQIAQVKPTVAFLGNALNLPIQNLAPPIFPAAGWWNEHAYKAIPSWLLSRMEDSFEPFGAHIKLTELQIEASAGLGFGVCALMLISWVAARRFRTAGAARILPRTSDQWHQAMVRWSPVISLFVYMVKSSLSASARIITPYYCLLIPLLLMGSGQERLLRQCWWKMCALGVFLLAALLVAINPGRPLWPAQAVLNQLALAHPQSALIARSKMLYDSYAVRWDALSELRQHIPLGEKRVGAISFITSTSLETSLWRPFGSRRVYWLRPEDSSDKIAERSLRFVVVGVDSLDGRARGLPFKDWLSGWLQSHHGRIVAQVAARNVATKDPTPWFVIELLSPTNAPDLPGTRGK